MKNKNIEVHETAFVTSTFRSFNEDLSQDYYAKLWSNPKTEKWIHDYLKKVSSEETFTHCLRNRYFLDQIDTAVKHHDVKVLINFGCGFSMYPFLLGEEVINIEIDKPEIIEYKKAKIEEWQHSAILPNRNIHFIGVDFSENYEQNLRSQIQAIKGNHKCFILLEGVLFFLDKEQTDKLFHFFDSIQYSGDYIGSASFQESLKDKLVFKKLMNFFSKKVLKTNESDYQTVEDEFYQNQKGYSLIEHQDYFSVSKSYKHKIQLERDMILNENFYIIKKYD
jgi:O-methyltransferase involved in polyketide biosynthesis